MAATGLIAASFLAVDCTHRRRTNLAGLPQIAKPSERAEIIATMLTVVEQVTNCKATPVSGDSGEMRGRLTACK